MLTFGAARCRVPVAPVTGRNMFGPIRGEWDEDRRGWWGPEPPYHAPVFVLTHHAHEPGAERRCDDASSRDQGCHGGLAKRTIGRGWARMDAWIDGRCDA